MATSTTDLDINDLFSLELKYENPNAALAPIGTTVTPQYGGNISQVVWKVKGREKQAYTLKYDSENRMTEAMYSDIGNSGTITGNRYDEKLTYDIRGNINTLQRWGLNGSCTWGLIDNLTYNYGASGYNPKNQLQSVTESSDLTKGFKTVANGSTYSYDTNGNMTADPNKSITNIVYNHLNLPTTITFTNNRTISFLYDAGGNKLRKTVVDNGTMQYIQDYVGGIEYRTNSSNVMALEAIYHAEGRITTISGTLKYEYAMKDHLGNTRLMFSDKNSNGVITQSGAPESSEVTQENHYYGFGMAMENVWYNTPSVSDNKYTYNAKEYNDDFGLNMNDYGARFYDAAIGKWNGFDAMAEAYQSMSPYHYAMNNPMRFIDPNGMYSNDGTTSRNTSALATDGGRVGGSSHFESNGQNGLASSKTGTKDDAGQGFSKEIVLDKSKLNIIAGGAGGKAKRSDIYLDKDNNEIRRINNSNPNHYYRAAKTDKGTLDVYDDLGSNNPSEVEGTTASNTASSGLRMPDFYSLNGGISVFGAISWNLNLTIDRHGQVYFSPMGFGIGKSAFAGGSLSLTASWLTQSNKPSSTETYGFLSGHGISVTGGYWGGGAYNNSPTNNGTRHAVGAGVMTPQIGASYNYTPDWLIFNRN